MTVSARIGVMLMLLFLGAAAAAPARAAGWQTTEFIFENTDPRGNQVVAALNPFGGFSSEQKIVVAEFERYLSEVAVYYQGMGFNAPPLPLVAGRNGGKAYRVHLFDYDDSLPIARAAARADGTTTLQADLSRAIRDGKATPRLFEDLAHELFHNVQHGYIGFERLDDRDWIVEGQAQALGMEAASRLRGIDLYRGKQDDYRLGGRPYYQALPAANTGRKEDYRTASFWRYVGEHYAASRKNGRAGIQPLAPDYSYLARVLDRPLAPRASAGADLRWLDGGLRQATGLGLPRLYAAFVTTFAAYVPDRLTSPVSASAQEAQDRWLQFVFGACPEIALSPRAPGGDALLPLRKNAARCFKTQIAGSGRADVSIQTRAETVGALQALQLGIAGGARIGSAQIVPSPAGGGYIGHWRFRIEAGAPYVFVVSNMAADPAATLNQDLSFNATYSQWVSNLSQPRAQAPASRNADTRPGAATAAPAQQPAATDATRAAAREELASGLAAQSNQTALGSGARFERRRPRCVEPFGATVCGPVTSISLSLTAGAIGDTTQTTGTGGGLAQFMSQMTAIADHGAMRTDREWRAALEEARDTEGSSVSITFPLVEYGFTGSFDNAAIIVNGGTGQGNFQALGPQDSIPGRGREYRQSGRVTIVEFTPYMMRGEFQAALTDMSAVDLSAGDDIVLPVHRQIRGEFVIAAPWEGDRDVTDYQQPSIDSAVQDLSQAFPVVGNGELADILPPAATDTPPDGTPASPPARAVGVFPRCACDCQPVSALAPGCKPICAVKLRACWAEDRRRKALQEASAQQATQQQADPARRQTRAEYIEGLRRVGMSQAQIDRIMPGVDAFWEENGGWGQ